MVKNHSDDGGGDSDSEDERPRDAHGRISRQYDPEDVIDLAREEFPRPIVGKDVIEATGCSRKQAHLLLGELEENGDLESKQTGPRARAYWLTDRHLEDLDTSFLDEHDWEPPEGHGNQRYDSGGLMDLVIDQFPEPLVAPQVIELFDCSKGTSHNYPNRLERDGYLRSKKTGASSRVYWLNPEGPDGVDGSQSPPPATADAD